MYVAVSQQNQWYTGAKHINIDIRLPKNVAFIIAKLGEHGYEAFAVGGCIRDAVMGREPHDWDITTNALPMQVKEIFNRTIDTGIKHGTVTIMLERVGYEVTTYRIDGEYNDGRHPKEVIFTSNLVEDLKRRDFTINAMAYNYKSGIVDEFDGIHHIDEKLIKCVGNPIDRFTEDALRMLRAIRFSAQLGFDIETETYEAIRTLSNKLSLISKERIQAETTKLITSNHPEKILDIYELGLSEYVFGTKTMMTSRKNFEIAADIMNHTDNVSYLRYAAMIHCEEHPEAILRFLKLDNKTVKIVSKLVNNRFIEIGDKQSDVRRAIVKVGRDIFEEYFLPYLKALIDIHYEGINISEERYNFIIESLEIIKRENHPLVVTDLFIRGQDLKEQGIEDGRIIGKTLEYLFDKALDDPSINEKSILIEMAKTKINEEA